MSANTNYTNDAMETGATGPTSTTHTGTTHTYETTEPMGGRAAAGSNAGKSAGNAIKSTFTKIHVRTLNSVTSRKSLIDLQGAGETFRGNVNAFLDTIVNTDNSRSQKVADRGAREMKSGVYEGTETGVTPNDKL
jgi:hypothetical protein